MARIEELESGLRWLPSKEAKPMDIPYEREKLRQFWQMFSDDDFSTDEHLAEAYRVFEPEGVERNE